MGTMPKEFSGVVDNRNTLDENYYFCHKGVWLEEFRHPGNTWDESDTKRRTEFELKVTNIIKLNRNDKNSRANSCFYRKFEKGMLFSAAEELEKRETIQKEAAADRKWIKRGVWATLATAFAALIAVVLSNYLTPNTEKITRITIAKDIRIQGS